MRRTLKHLAILTVVTTAICLPAALLAGRWAAPLWYAVIAALFSALGMGLFALVLGAIALFAGRARPDGGLRIALAVSGGFAVLSSYAVIAAQLSRA